MNINLILQWIKNEMKEIEKEIGTEETECNYDENQEITGSLVFQSKPVSKTKAKKNYKVKFLRCIILYQ